MLVLGQGLRANTHIRLISRMICYSISLSRILNEPLPPSPGFRRISYIIKLLSTNLSPPFVDHVDHYSSAYPIRHLPKSSVSCGNQDSIVLESSPHKCGQRIWWGALNVVAITIPSDMLGLTPSLKLFLYSVTSFGNVPLTWPRLTSPALPSEGMVSSKLHQPLRPRIRYVTLLPY